MLGGPSVLLIDCVRVVTGHVNRRPPEARLPLAFRDNSIERCGLEVAQGVQVQFGSNSCKLTRRSKSVGKRVWVKRSDTTWLHRKHEPVVANADVANSSQFALGKPELGQGGDGSGIDRDSSDSGPSLRTLHSSTTFCRDYSLVDHQRPVITVDIAPAKPACFPPAHPSRHDDLQANPVANVKVCGGTKYCEHLGQSWGSYWSRLFSRRPRRELRVGYWVRKRVPAPFAGKPARAVKDCADISDGLSAGAFLLELAEVALYVVWPGRDNALPSDAVLDMEAPHALVPCCGQRAQVLPAVVPPTCDGVVERSGWAPRSRRLIRNHLWNLVLLSHKVSEFALGGSPRAVKEPALVPNSPSGISFEVNAQLPSVGALVEPWSNAAGHHTSAGHQSQHLLGLKLGPTYQVGVTPSRLNLLAGIL